MATAAHNEKRRDHCAETMFTVDTTMAKALQGLLNENPGLIPVDKRPKEYKDCFQNYY